MVTRLITPPQQEPVSLEEVKLQLRIDHIDDDDMITGLIAAARERCEHILGRSIMHQTWERVIDGIPGAEIKLEHPPLIQVDSVKYLDYGGQQQTFASDQYRVDVDNEPGRIALAPGCYWPSILDVPNAVRVRYQAGYESKEAVPAGIKNWIKLAVRALYDGCGVDGIDASMQQFDALLDRCRIWRL